ncbi:ATP-grasp domain-containing protein [Albidovulum sp.]|uniref:ATP-grasp domain-containing protein n=1 Tax=Albidovulum sp. TaxID=1872424 RepID=UPI0039B8E457
MLLTEDIGKELLAEQGIRIPRGIIVSGIADFNAAIADFNGPVVLKAQIRAGGRGKGGGILFGDTLREAEAAFEALYGATVNGFEVSRILLEDRLEIVHERYIGLLIDGGAVWLLLGRQGGVDIEETTANDPDNMRRIRVDALDGPDSAEVMNACRALGIPDGPAYADLAARLFRLFRTRDAIAAEINPVAELPDGSLIALDARITLDDSALYRQEDILPRMPSADGEDRDGNILSGLRLLGNGGSVAYAGIGGGISLTIADWFAACGAPVGALIDIDDMILHRETAEGIEQLLDHVDADPTIRVLLLNVMTCGYDLGEVTADVLAAMDRRKSYRRKPVVLHLHGNGEPRACELLRARSLHNCADLAEAVERSISLAREVCPA